MGENGEKIQRRAKALFHQSPYATALWSTDLKIVDVNDAFVELTGYSRDQAISMTPKDFRAISASGEGFEEARSLKRNAKGECVFDFSTGKKIVVRHTIPLMDQRNDLENILTIYQDITKERVQLEEIKFRQEKTEKVMQYFRNEIDQLSAIYTTGAQGDLTVKYDLSEPDNDTRDVYEILRKLQEAVRGIIKNLKINISDVNEKMQNLTSTADNASRNVEDASKGVNQIAKNAGVVSENAQKASEGIDQMSKAMQDMSAAVEEITSSMESVSTQAKSANDAAKDGAILADMVNKDMTEITAATTNVHRIIKEIEKQMADISKIIVLIRDLANQTNLLALNAAIEAARAGEHGRGFAVVASEVKSLAQESRSSAEKIEDMITQLNAATRKAMGAIDASKELVNKGVAASADAFSAFNKIQAAAETVANSASEVAAASEEQAATTEEITASVHEIASLIEKTAKEAGDAAAATEESAAALDEITRMIRTVDTVAVSAMEANKRFRVD